MSAAVLGWCLIGVGALMTATTGLLLWWVGRHESKMSDRRYAMLSFLGQGLAKTAPVACIIGVLLVWSGVES